MLWSLDLQIFKFCSYKLPIIPLNTFSLHLGVVFVEKLYMNKVCPFFSYRLLFEFYPFFVNTCPQESCRKQNITLKLLLIKLLSQFAWIKMRFCFFIFLQETVLSESRKQEPLWLFRSACSQCYLLSFLLTVFLVETPCALYFFHLDLGTYNTTSRGKLILPSLNPHSVQCE